MAEFEYTVEFVYLNQLTRYTDLWSQTSNPNHMLRLNQINPFLNQRYLSLSLSVSRSLALVCLCMDFAFTYQLNFVKQYELWIRSSKRMPACIKVSVERVDLGVFVFIAKHVLNYAYES